MTSFESLRAQGVFPDDLVCHEDEPVSFETGNGRTESSSTFNTIGAIFGHHKSYVLSSCPTVRSMGEIINQGFAFIWFPDELPFFVPKDALQMTADSSRVRVHKASRVEGNVPIFSEDVQFAMPAQKKLMHDSARSSKKSKDITFDAGARDIFFDPGVPSPSAAGSRDPDPTVEVEEPKASAEDPDQIMPPPPLPPPAKPPGDGALADSERKSSEDDGLTKHRKLVKEAQSLEHRLSHFPKNPACPTWQRSRMYRKCVAAKRADPLADRGMLPEVMQFGERIATDFIIVRKLKDGKENATQVVRDEYSGWVRAYPIAKRDTDTVSRNLLLFLGPAYDRTTVMCKPDQAIEILAACKRLGFVNEDTLENRFPHNSQLERDIRTIEEIARATRLGAGFEVVPDLWPLSVDYVATMLFAQHIAAGKEQTRHYFAVGTELTGRKLLLGQLVHYRVDPTLRDKIAPSTSPGLFAGFRYDSGPKSFKGVLFVLDYEKVKNRTPGYAIPAAVPTEEVWVDDKQPPQLPLKRAAETALANFDQPELEDIQPLDIPFSAIDGVTTPGTHNEHITMDRVFKFGATPGCRGCEFEATKHTPLCRARFNALIRADRIAKAPKTPPVVPAEPDGSRATGDADPGGHMRKQRALNMWSKVLLVSLLMQLT